MNCSASKSLDKKILGGGISRSVPTYTNGVSKGLFKVGICLPAGPYVTDDDIRYIVVGIIKASII